MLLDPPDSTKEAENVRRHGISLYRFPDMDFARAVSAVDVRHSTPTETRWIFTGPIEGRLYVGIVTYRGERTRPISLRPASRKERRLYGEATARA